MMRYKLNENKELVKIDEKKSEPTKAFVLVGSSQTKKSVNKRLMEYGAKFKEKSPKDKENVVAEFNVIFKNLEDAKKFKDEMQGEYISVYISGYSGKKVKTKMPDIEGSESELFKNFKL